MTYQCLIRLKIGKEYKPLDLVFNNKQLIEKTIELLDSGLTLEQLDFWEMNAEDPSGS